MSTTGSNDDEEGGQSYWFLNCLFARTSSLFSAAIISLFPNGLFFKNFEETASDVRLDDDEGAGRVRVQSLELSLIQAC